MQKITFGTSGWRAVIAEDFTFSAVRRLSSAIADFILAGTKSPEMLVAYDARFMGEKFAECAAKILLSKGIRVQLTMRDVPTPAVSAAILGEGLSGAINITASHNPAEYSGIKFSPAWGGPALPEDTKKIEELLEHTAEVHSSNVLDLAAERSNGRLRFTDCKKHYFQLLRQNIDFDVIKAANVRLVFDPLYGSARGYFDELLQCADIAFNTINAYRDPYFGGGPPEPDGHRLSKLRHVVQSDDEIVIGLATDGDGDRFGIIDRDGCYISPNRVLPLLAGYLHRTRADFQGRKLVRSVATTHMMDRVANDLGVELVETPVGFKYVGEKLASKEAFFGGEESAGLSMLNHVPEKDGILACLLTLEMVASTGKSVGELIAEQHDKLGALFSDRHALPLSESAVSSWESLGSIDNDAFGTPLVSRSSLDGFKFHFKNNEWLLFRKSGTEPVVRAYAEAESAERVRDLLARGQAVLANLG